MHQNNAKCKRLTYGACSQNKNINSTGIYSILVIYNNNNLFLSLKS